MEGVALYYYTYYTINTMHYTIITKGEILCYFAGLLWMEEYKAAAPFMRSRSHYQSGCVTLINRISAEAVMWHLLSSCICVTNALLK